MKIFVREQSKNISERLTIAKKDLLDNSKESINDAFKQYILISQDKNKGDYLSEIENAILYLIIESKHPIMGVAFLLLLHNEVFYDEII